MPTYLDDILESTRQRIARERRQSPMGDLEREAGGLPAARDLAAAVRGPGMSLVAEVKRRSPSAGDLQAGADPGALAEAYEEGGARAVSVLTEPHFFEGSLGDLAVVRQRTRLPVLRKDFILDPYQVVQARAAGADAVLLIVGAVGDPGLLAELHAACGDLGLSALVEVHAAAELDAAMELEPALVGVNQRDLRTFSIDRGLAARLRAYLPPEVAVVAESGISTRAEVEALEAAGVDGVLVGEALMRSADPRRAVAALLGREP